ncbi:hypothetical protein [Pedobacter nanyangensis]|uniref:hypothetical protein n=1 Tax=Pedobacter nanyangensis TaxID=1562389 RepID=UPI000DE28CAA|nr:hypothetical protein [Pedobacter nanyangensis]
MKKLTNVSPFLLLLFPVFVVMLFAFASNSSEANHNEEGLVKTTSASENATIVKAASVILR